MIRRRGLELAPNAGPLGRLLSRFGGVLFVAGAVFSMLPGFYIRTEVNAPLYFALKFLSLPIASATIAVAFAVRADFVSSSKRPIAYRLFVVLLIPVLIFLSSGWASAVNALLPGTPYVLQGVVSEKYETHGRSSTTWVVGVTAEGRVTRITVSRAAYQSIQVGSVFRQPRRMGPLGFSYVPK